MAKSNIYNGRWKRYRMVKKINSIFPKCVLGENPLWNDSDRMFYYTDIVKGTIYRTSLGNVHSDLILNTNYQIGAFVFDKHGNLVLLTEKGLVLAYRTVDGRYNLDDKIKIGFSFIKGERFNDAIVDLKGRILAGIKRNDNQAGRLVSIDKDGSIITLLTDLQISNGMGFDDDCKIFYHTDSGCGKITKWKYDLNTGKISNPVVIKNDFPDNGVPDGMTLDTDGNIYSACWGAGCILKISPAGNLLEKITVPAINVSSVIIGGKDFNILFVTSATCGLDFISNYDGLCYYLEIDDFSGKKDFLV